jgi:hypothetical protein
MGAMGCIRKCRSVRFSIIEFPMVGTLLEINRSNQTHHSVPVEAYNEAS